MSNDYELAFSLLKWYETTHGNCFGHDHHCPVPSNLSLPDDRCTCGWSGVLRSELAIIENERNLEVTE